jgi:hypothetical protein
MLQATGRGLAVPRTAKFERWLAREIGPEEGGRQKLLRACGHPNLDDDTSGELLPEPTT